MHATSRVIAALAAAIAFSLPLMAQESNDQDFEQDAGKFSVTYWRGTSAGELTDKVAHGGKKSMQLVGGAGADDVTALMWKNPGIKFLAGQKYTVSIWVKAESAGKVQLKIDLPATMGAKGLSDESIRGTSDWTQLSQTFTVAKTDQPEAISLQLTGPGRVWADDFKIDGKTGLAWTKTIEIDPKGITTENAMLDLLKQQGVKPTGYANWFTGRWPYISFIGGMCMANRSEDLEFFYEKPFKWWTEVLDYAMEDGGSTYGIRAKIWLYKDAGAPQPLRSFLLTIRTDTMLDKGYIPSYIYANGRMVWDAKLHPIQKGKILVPFSIEEATEPVIDMVIDKKHTPNTKGLAFRMFFVQYLGEPGVKVDLKGAEDAPAKGSPADKLEKFRFGLFPSGYDAWTTNGPTFAELKKKWKPNFRPNYPVDEVYLCPNIEDQPATGKYHDFMVTYGGANLMANKPNPEMAKASYMRGALGDSADVNDAKMVLGLGPNFQVHWFHEGSTDQSSKAAIEAAKKATGAPERVKSVQEPFPPALAPAKQYEYGTDILIYKNEEDPQYNIMMSMCRGAGRTYGKPFGFYWEQTHYPYPSLDEKLNACLLFYLSGGSWIGAEADSAPSFEKEIVADWVYPYVEALRFAMVHPARGANIVPVGIVWTDGEKYNAPFNPFGEMDTFLRHIEYDHATRTLKTEPAFTHPYPWMPADRNQWRFENSGHIGWFYDSLSEMQGYDLLDVFFPQFGDAFTARITRLLTGTPYGPVDFVYGDKATPEHLKSFGVLAMLGHGVVRDDVEKNLTAAVEAGVPLVIGCQQFYGGSVNIPHKPFGLTLSGAADASGAVTGIDEFYKGKEGNFSGKLLSYKGDGWETVASVGEKPLVIRKTFGKGQVYVFLGQWTKDGGAALRPILSALAAKAAPLVFDKPDDTIEYVPYKKGAGAWVAVFNHGNIVIGCDRITEQRATPPEPLFSKRKGPYKGSIEFRLDKLGLENRDDWELYEVLGIDGKAFDDVISGNKTFQVKALKSTLKDGVIKADVTIDKRAEYVIAPKGKGSDVFFGK